MTEYDDIATGMSYVYYNMQRAKERVRIAFLKT